MSGIVENLRLVPPPAIWAAEFSALARSAGAERRQKVAHGVSRGAEIKNSVSPGGA